MGKSLSRQRELERQLLVERDDLFQEFSHAKKEIHRNFNHQKVELEDAFHQEIEKMYEIHDRQIKTIKLQMRDSQLEELQDKLRGKLSRHLSWPIAESTPKQSIESSIAACTSCGQNGMRIDNKGNSFSERRTSQEWQVLVEHLKFALNNQKALFEGALLEEKFKMQKQLESDRKNMEENIFKRLNETLQYALKERDALLRESNNLQSISKTILTDWDLIKEITKNKKVKSDRHAESDSEEENSGDSGVEEKCKKKTDKRGNYWRIKYTESQRKHLKKTKEIEERFKEQQKNMQDDFETTKNDLKERHFEELREAQMTAAKNLQLLLKEERQIHKDMTKELNSKIIEISTEKDDLKEQLEDMQLLLNSDVCELNKELKEKLELLTTIISQG